MAKADYVAAGLTITELETVINDAAGILPTFSTAASTGLTLIDEAITAIGQAVCTWDGSPWWWQRATGHFQTNTKTLKTAANSGASRSGNVSTIDTTAAHGLQVGQTVKIADVSDSTFDGTWEVAAISGTTFDYNQVGDDVGAATAGTGSVYVVSYPLRGIDITGAVTSTDADKIAWKGWAISRIYYDDNWRLKPLRWDQYRQKLRLLATTGATKPFNYCIHGEEPYLYVYPAANSAYDFYIDLVERHSKITNAGSTDTALIIPAEFQFPLYAQGAEWLLKHKSDDPDSLRNCPPFMDGIQRMRAASPENYPPDDESNLFRDAQTGYLPHDRKVMIDDGWVLIGDHVTIP